MANNLNVYFISEDYVKEQSAILDNVDDNFISSHILESMNIHIQNIVGTKQYDALVADYDETGGTFSTAIYKTLIDDYIQPCLLYYTLYESVYDLYMRFTNKGITTQASEYSATVDTTLMEKRRMDFQNKAEFYAERLMKFLLDNQDTYILYRDWCDNDNPHGTMVPEMDTNYFNGMYLKSGNRSERLDLDPRKNSRFRYL